MSLHFYPLTVKEVKKETADCVSVVFTIPENLRTIFQFEQGQNIAIKKKNKQ
jgi:ring-1,2-phenylacetyl-CoA epoxidase subunit PaaE